MPGQTRISTPDVPNFVEHKIAGPLQKYLNDLSGFLQREFRRRPESQQAVTTIYLSSPNGTIYSVGITDVGAVTITLVAS